MGRRGCCSKEELNRGAWTAHEDKILSEFIQIHGEGRWRNLPKKAGLKRCGKSCRLRWLNYLRPGIKRGNISPDEEELIIRLHKLLGNRWSLIAGRLPGRTDNEIKNYWNTNLGKKVHPPPPPPLSKTNKSNQPDIETRPHVVRTKAIKCTKVVLNYDDPPSHHHNHDHKVEQFDTDKQISPIFSLEDSISLVEANTLNIGSSSSSFTATATPTQGISSADFTLNFNLGELCLPDLLNSDFSDICDFNYSSIDIDKSHYSKDLSLPNSKDQPVTTSSQEMLQSCWSSTSSVEDCLVPNVATNFHSFTSLLDAGGEWLAS